MASPLGDQLVFNPGLPEPAEKRLARIVIVQPGFAGRRNRLFDAPPVVGAAFARENWRSLQPTKTGLK